MQMLMVLGGDASVPVHAGSYMCMLLCRFLQMGPQVSQDLVSVTLFNFT